jgi:hypothetical protein
MWNSILIPPLDMHEWAKMGLGDFHQELLDYTSKGLAQNSITPTNPHKSERHIEFSYGSKT